MGEYTYSATHSTLVLDGQLSASSFGRFIPGAQWSDEWVGPEPVWTLVPAGDRIPDLSHTAPAPQSPLQCRSVAVDVAAFCGMGCII